MSLSINNIYQYPNKPAFLKEKQTSFASNYNDELYEAQNEPIKHSVKNVVKAITGSIFSILAFNFGLYIMQDLVSSKLLIGKINKHYTDKINDKEKIESLALDMKSKLKLDDVKLFYSGKTSDAYYTSAKNAVVVGEKEYSSFFHELGHAFIENKTKFLKTLQHGRGNYTFLALALYALTNQNKNNNEDSKFNRFLHKFSAIIPIAAYSPELITEGMATKYGLKYLKTKREDFVKKLFDEGKISKMPEKAELISKELFKNIKRSYLTCFGTYLFVPASIILLDKLDNWAHKRN